MPIQQFWALISFDDHADAITDAQTAAEWLVTVPQENIPFLLARVWESDTLAHDINHKLELDNPMLAGHIEDALLSMEEEDHRTIRSNQLAQGVTP